MIQPKILREVLPLIKENNLYKIFQKNWGGRYGNHFLVKFEDKKYWDEFIKEKIISIKDKFQNINSYGSIGCEYFDIAKGIRDFTVLSRLYPWDHIPGVFIVRQAGGHDCHFDKKEYKFYENSKNLIVSNSMNLNYDILNLIEGK